MRISDWSSDVCSSDLADAERAAPIRAQREGLALDHLHQPHLPVLREDGGGGGRGDAGGKQQTTDRHPRARRSEEHTSELQSLMRISYAVFCLKKKKKQQHKNNKRQHQQHNEQPTSN